jgi:YVTN family beta-propeller protein
MARATHAFESIARRIAQRPVPRSNPPFPAASAGALGLLALALQGSCDRPTAILPDHTLTVEVAGYGKGTVTSDPAGIDCTAGSGPCTLTLPRGTQVSLTGTPDERSTFGGWSQACSGSGACTVTLSGDQTVGASFGNPRLAAADVGPAGGTLVSADGRVTLTVPAGALGAATTLTIEAIEASELGPEFRELDVDAAYRLGPEGTTFQKPVAVSVDSDQVPQIAANSVAVRFEVLLSSHAGAVAPLDGLAIEVATDRVRVHGAVAHFSPLVRTGWLNDGDTGFSANFTFRATGVPDAVLWTTPFPVVVDLILEHRRKESVIDAFFRDESTAPVVAPTDFAALERVRQTASEGGEFAWTTEFSRRFDYRCSTNGTGAFVGSFEIDVEDTLIPIPGLPPVPIRTRISASTTGAALRVEKPVICTLDLPPSGPSLTSRALLPLARSAEAMVVRLAAAVSGARAGPTASRSIAAASGSPVLLATVAADTLTSPPAFDKGRLNLFDISNPAAPVRLDSLAQFCPGARNVFLAESPFVPGLTITGVSPRYRGLCQTSFPVPAGTGLVDWGHVPGSGAAILNPDGSLSHRYVVTSFSFSQLAIVDLRNQPNRNVTLTSTRSCPFSVVATATHAYVVAREGEAGTPTASCNEHRGLYVVDVTSAQLDFVVRFGSKPREVVLAPDGSKAYVTDVEENRIHVVDLATRAVVRTIATGSGPVGIDVTRDGRHLLVTNFNARRVQAIEEATGEVVAETDSRGPQPVKVLLAPDGATVVVLNFGDATTPGSVSLYTLERP